MTINHRHLARTTQKSLTACIQILALSISMWGCKSTDHGSSPAADTSNACPVPTVVHYSQPATADSSKSSLLPGGAAINVGFSDLINVEVTPDDFKKLDDNVCKEDGTCVATLTKPIKVNVNVPISLFAKLAVGYQQAKGDQPGVCLRDVKIGAKISPICLGKILDFSINLGLGLSSKEDTVNHKTTYDAKPYCNANFSCSIPFLSANAKMDQHGLTFNSSVSAQSVVSNTLVKVSAQPAKPQVLSFNRFPEALRKLKEYFTPSGAHLLAGDQADAGLPDIYWENLVSCG